MVRNHMVIALDNLEAERCFVKIAKEEGFIFLGEVWEYLWYAVPHVPYEIAVQKTYLADVVSMATRNASHISHE